MPAAQHRRDRSHENNSADPTDISGVGYLYPSYKTEVYSRDGLASNTAHNYYAPYYSQYIPATSRPQDAAGSPYGGSGGPLPSGIDGSATRTGFNGFLVELERPGPYHNWEFAWKSSFHPNSDSKCLFSQVLPGIGKLSSARCPTATARSRSTPTRAARPT